MTDDSALTPRRRNVLSATAAAGISSLAGCSWLNGQAEPPGDESPDDSPSPPRDTSPPPEGSGPLEGIYGYRVASSFVDGGNGSPGDPWVLQDDVLDEPGVVVLDAGSFTTDEDGLATSMDVDYERWSVWLRGAGVRTTELRKRSGSSQNLLSFVNDDTGNFGGVRDMALYGSYPNGEESTGHLLHSNGAIIDLMLSNLIVRYGWRDGIRIETSSSGTRIHNCWVENNGGWAINLGGGTRAKLSNLHVVTSENGGINFNPDVSQLSNASFYNCAPSLRVDSEDSEVANCYFTLPDGGIAVDEVDSSRSNSFANLSVFETHVGVRAAAPGSDYANVNLRWSTGEAMRISGDGVTVTGLNVVDAGSARGGLPALDVSGDDVRITGATFAQENDPFTNTHRLARISGDGVVVSDVVARGGPWGLVVDGATETVLDNVRGLSREKVSDGGTRTLINGTGTNDGDPRSAGEWNDHGDYAHVMGATVWDVSTSPWTPYRADGEGTWLEG